MTTDQLFERLGDRFYSLKKTPHAWEALGCFIDIDEAGEDGGRFRSEGMTPQEALEDLFNQVGEYSGEKAS